MVGDPLFSFGSRRKLDVWMSFGSVVVDKVEEVRVSNSKSSFEGKEDVEVRESVFV